MKRTQSTFTIESIWLARFLALLLFSVFCLGSSTLAHAQSQTSGSIYSRYGIGERQLYNSPKSQAMGGGGIGLRSIDFVNHANPASLSDQIFTRFAGGFSYQGMTESDASGEESRLRAGYVTALQLSFPLMTGKLGFGLSFEPYTRVNYRVETTGSLKTDPDSETSDVYQTAFQGNGGLQRLAIGLGYAIRGNLQVGFRTDIIFGRVEEIQQTDFQDLRIRDNDVTSSTRLNGITGTIGLRYTARKLLNEQDALALGLIFTLPLSLSGTRDVTTGQEPVAFAVGDGETGTVNVPLSFGVGLAYQPGQTWTIIADLQYEEWSAFESELNFPGYTDGNSARFSDRLRLSVGAEFYPAIRSLSRFLQRVAVRFGAYTDNSYVSPDADHEISSYGITGGISFPSLTGGTSLDINIEAGRRGTTDFGLIRDNFVRLGINLNFGERWFDRAKLR